MAVAFGGIGIPEPAKQMSQETGMPLQECIDRIAEDLSVSRVTIDFDGKNDCFRLVPVPPDRGGREARRGESRPH